MSATAEPPRALYICNGCNQELPFVQFLEGGRITTDTGWLCKDCNRCPDCGLGMGNGRTHSHRCRVPALTKALGVTLVPHEKRLIGWLASSLDRLDTQAFVDLFTRARSHGK